MVIPEDPRSPEFYEVQPEPPVERPEPSGLNQWLMAIALALAIAVAIAIGYTIHEQRAAGRLIEANGHLAAQLTETQNQMAALTAKINALSAPKPVLPAAPVDETWLGTPAPAVAPPAKHVSHARARRSERPAEPSPWQRQMQAQLAAQQNRLNAEEQALAKTQSDLSAQSASAQSGLSSLGGAIAKDHAQLVALERLGQRDYYEFDLTRSKKFVREGPVSLDLKHTSAKHQNYDLDLMVDDYKLSKKHVNLYEPVVLETSESPQPVELVVNRITKNEIHGYVSAPKSYEQRADSESSQPAGAENAQSGIAGASQATGSAKVQPVQSSSALAPNPETAAAQTVAATH